MLTKLTIRNFKRFADVEIDLDSPVVFIGPNNSGKTSAMQALALWDIGLRQWREKRSGRSTPERRPGVTVNRRDLVSIPVPEANLLWHELHVRDVQRVDGKPQTRNVLIDVVVEGVTAEEEWKCGLEFDFANAESFYCRPLRLEQGKAPTRMPVPPQAGSTEIAFLPPMSGLAATEDRLDAGAINVRIGEGRTAEVLRNLCFKIFDERPDQWEAMAERIQKLFGADIKEPRYVPERGQITMSYAEGDIELDLSSSGRGLQQTLLILAYMYANPGAVLLLDEPDAHLEILRQREIYEMITEVARESGSQIIAASHSEVLLNEAAGRHTVIAFIGNPHPIDGRTAHLGKALKEIGFEHYSQAEQTKWVLYLEGSTDLAILRALAERLGHASAAAALERPYVHYIGNQLSKAQQHFFGLREAVPELLGIAILDRDAVDWDREPGDSASSAPLTSLRWRQREIENYLSTREALEAYAAGTTEEDGLPGMLGQAEGLDRLSAMQRAIDEIEGAQRTLGNDPWGPELKVSDEFLPQVFRRYFELRNLPSLMSKRDFHELARFAPEDAIDSEVGEKLDAIAEVASQARGPQPPTP